MKNIRFLLCFTLSAAAFIHTTLVGDFQPKDIQVDAPHLFATVRTALKTREYAQDGLPNDFSYLVQLLAYGQEVSNRIEYARAVFSVFSKVIGGSQYVNAYAYQEFLEQLVPTLKPYFVNYRTSHKRSLSIGLDGDMYDRFKEAVSNMLYVQFSSQYDVFRSSPLQFFDELSQAITDIAKQEVEAQQARVAIKRFLELCMSKLVWSPEEHAQVWDNVKSIAQVLSLLTHNNIIEDPNDLNDMYWTLLHRFNFFVDLVGGQLPLSFYEQVKNDCAQNNLLFLTLAEQDACILTKQECLRYTLIEGEAKCRAYEKGILIS